MHGSARVLHRLVFVLAILDDPEFDVLCSSRRVYSRRILRPTVPPPTGESALVAQLISKVHELELTNEQILASQCDTATKLQEAQIAV